MDIVMVAILVLLQTCKVCNQTFSQIGSCNRHFQNKHTEKAKSYASALQTIVLFTALICCTRSVTIDWLTDLSYKKDFHGFGASAGMLWQKFHVYDLNGQMSNKGTPSSHSNIQKHHKGDTRDLCKWKILQESENK